MNNKELNFILIQSTFCGIHFDILDLEYVVKYI